MIEEPPLLRILTRGSRNRPTEAQIKAFEGAQTGHICDALGGQGAMDMGVKPLVGTPHSLCGPALTADCGPRDILALLTALGEMDPGDVVMQSTGGWTGCAGIGDMVSGMAKNGGAAGVVTDGCARDLPGIQALDFPLFCRGLSPNSPYSKGPGSVGYPVMMGGVEVSSGDMIVGDQDGVVVVPFAKIDEVIAALEDVRAAETALEHQVKDGLIRADDITDLANGPQTARA